MVLGRVPETRQVRVQDAPDRGLPFLGVDLDFSDVERVSFLGGYTRSILAAMCLVNVGGQRSHETLGLRTLRLSQTRARLPGRATPLCRASSQRNRTEGGGQ